MGLHYWKKIEMIIDFIPQNCTTEELEKRMSEEFGKVEKIEYQRRGAYRSAKALIAVTCTYKKIYDTLLISVMKGRERITTTPADLSYEARNCRNSCRASIIGVSKEVDIERITEALEKVKEKKWFIKTTTAGERGYNEITVFFETQQDKEKAINTSLYCGDYHLTWFKNDGAGSGQPFRGATLSNHSRFKKGWQHGYQHHRNGYRSYSFGSNEQRNSKDERTDKRDNINKYNETRVYRESYNRDEYRNGNGIYSQERSRGYQRGRVWNRLRLID